MHPLRLTYCGNVHAAGDLAAVQAMLRTSVAPIATAARRAGRTCGLGGYWPAAVAAELAERAEARDRLRGWLDRLYPGRAEDLYLCYLTPAMRCGYCTAWVTSKGQNCGLPL